MQDFILKSQIFSKPPQIKINEFPSNFCQIKGLTSLLGESY